VNRSARSQPRVWSLDVVLLTGTARRFIRDSSLRFKVVLSFEGRGRAAAKRKE
jgi:hypothetical protein